MMTRTNFRWVISTLLCFFFCVALSAQEKDFSKILGNWSYSAPDAPYGYQDGSFEFQQDQGKLTAKLKIQGSVMEVKDIKVQGDTFTSSFYVDGNLIDLSIVQKENQLEGQADAGGMVIPITFKRAE